MATKVCTMCEQDKPFEDFWKASKGKFGYQAQCKDCQRDYRRQRHTENPDLWRVGNLKRNYNLSLEEYRDLFIVQNNACAICERTTNSDGRSLAVDHDHETGEVRGILCISCNRGLGYFQDDPILLEKASQYLYQNKLMETRQ